MFLEILILMISATSKAGKNRLRVSTSHSFVCRLISCETHFSLQGLMFLDGRNDHSLGIHWWRQILMLEPSTTRHFVPFFSNSRPCNNAFQVGEVWVGNAVSKRSPFGKYLAFNRRAHRLLGKASNLQTCLASRA